MDRAILVVDDQPVYADVVADVLRLSPLRVTAVYQPEAVFTHLAEQLPDLIVCDVQMPGMDGPTLVRRMRALGYQVPVLLMSSGGLPATDLPAVRVVRKTLDAVELIDLIQRQFA